MPPDFLLEAENRKRSAGGIAAFVAFDGVGAMKSLGLGVDGQYAIAESEPSRKCKLHQGAGAFVRNDLEMMSLAADDAAKRNGAVKGVLRGRGMIKGDRHGKRDFERTGHDDNFERGMRLRKSSFCPLKQHRGNIFIKARLDNEEAGALETSS